MPTYANHANAKNQGCRKVHSKLLQVTNGFSPQIWLETQVSSEVQKADPSTQQELPTSATTQRGVMTLSRRPMHGKKGPELKPAGTRLMNIPKPSSSIHFFGFLAIIHCYRNHTGIIFVCIKIRIWELHRVSQFLVSSHF